MSIQPAVSKEVVRTTLQFPKKEVLANHLMDCISRSSYSDSEEEVLISRVVNAVASFFSTAIHPEKVYETGIECALTDIPKESQDKLPKINRILLEALKSCKKVPITSTPDSGCADSNGSTSSSAKEKPLSSELSPRATVLDSSDKEEAPQRTIKEETPKPLIGCEEEQEEEKGEFQPLVTSSSNTRLSKSNKTALADKAHHLIEPFYNNYLTAKVFNFNDGSSYRVLKATAGLFITLSTIFICTAFVTYPIKGFILSRVAIDSLVATGILFGARIGYVIGIYVTSANSIKLEKRLQQLEEESALLKKDLQQTPRKQRSTAK